MEKILSVLLSVFLLLVTQTGCSAKQTAIEADDPVIALQIGSSKMTIDGEEQELDPGRGTAPTVENGRTLLPIRTVCEAMGAAVEWEGETRPTVIAKDDSVILLSIGSSTAFANEKRHTLDVAPVIRNDRAMLPIRFIAENLSYSVQWDADKQMITLSPKKSQSADGQTAALPQDSQTTK